MCMPQHHATSPFRAPEFRRKVPRPFSRMYQVFSEPVLSAVLGNMRDRIIFHPFPPY
jgi:hypothetical protein